MKDNTSNETALNKDVSAFARLSVAISVVAVLLVLALSLFLKQLPTNVLEYDISDNKLYEISAQTEAFIAELAYDVEIIVIEDRTKTDARLIKFLDKYEALSGRITVRYIDPVEHPSVLDKYDAGEETVVVLCEELGKQSVIKLYGFDSYEESIYGYDYMYYLYYDAYSLATFDADGQITGAINNIISGKTIKLYYLDGHGEGKMNPTLEASIYKAGYTTGTVNLLRDGGLPEDCELLISYVPALDLADVEYEMLREYLDSGGKVMLIIDSKELRNFNTLLADFGFKINDGYLGDRSSYYSAYASEYGYYCILPELSQDSEITSGIKNDALILFARGMSRITANLSDVTVESFMTSTDDGICYYDNSNYIEGRFMIGAAATRRLAAGGTARLTVISAQFIASEDITNTISNVSNLDIVLNAVSASFGEVSSVMAIPSKSVAMTNNNRIDTPVWNVLFIAVIPLAAIAAGLVCWNRRRKR